MRTIAIAALTAMLPASAMAGPVLPCGDRAQMLKQLEQSHAEVPQVLGLGSDGGLVEMLVSPDGTWTMILTYPKRPTCIVAVGRGWELLPSKVGDPI